MDFRLAGHTILALAMLLQIAPAGASEARSDLVYKAYYASFNLARLDLSMKFGNVSYDVRSKITMSGIASQLMPWKMLSRARGLFRGSLVEPLSSDQWNNWGGKERIINLRFLNGVPQIIRIKPDHKADDRPAVLFEELQSTMDPVSAILTLLASLQKGNACQARIPVFDGRRRYDLVAEGDGTEQLKRSARSPYSGPAVRCILWMDKKAGFKERSDPEKGRYDRRARVWFGSVFDGLPPVPVRLTYETRFGVVHGYLADAANVTNGAKRRLGAQTPNSSPTGPH